MNGDNNETIKATILHPNTTSTLMAIQDDVPNPRFLVETLDKCQQRSKSNLRSPDASGKVDYMGLSNTKYFNNNNYG